MKILGSIFMPKKRDKKKKPVKTAKLGLNSRIRHEQQNLDLRVELDMKDYKMINERTL